MTYELDNGQPVDDLAAEIAALKSERQRLEAENSRLRQAAAQPAGEYPRVDPETGRMMYGSWYDLADPFVDKFDPRNNPNDVAYQAALKDREMHFAMLEAANQPKLAEDGIHYLDENGEPIPTDLELQQEAMVAEWEKTLATEPTWRFDSASQTLIEWLHPDLPEYDEANDIHGTAQASKEARDREAKRREAFISLNPGPYAEGTVDAAMRARGLLPPLNPNDPEQKAKKDREDAKTFLYESINKLRESTPEGRAVREYRVQEAMRRGDRELAVAIQDGRA